MKLTYCTYCRRDLWKGETIEQHVLDNHPYDVKQYNEYRAYGWTKKSLKEFMARTVFEYAQGDKLYPQA